MPEQLLLALLTCSAMSTSRHLLRVTGTIQNSLLCMSDMLYSVVVLNWIEHHVPQEIHTWVGTQYDLHCISACFL